MKKMKRVVWIAAMMMMLFSMSMTASAAGKSVTRTYSLKPEMRYYPLQGVVKTVPAVYRVAVRSRWTAICSKTSMSLTLLQNAENTQIYTPSYPSYRKFRNGTRLIKSVIGPRKPMYFDIWVPRGITRIRVTATNGSELSVFRLK